MRRIAIVKLQNEIEEPYNHKFIRQPQACENNHMF